MHRDAFVLHTRPWSDSGLLVDLLVRDEGRVRAVARGIRRKRRGGNPCQLFQPLLVVLGGRTTLKTLRQVEARGTRITLTGAAAYAGLYANEVLLRALPETEPSNALFDAYSALLLQLSRPGGDLEPPLRSFERLLLEALGYGVDFSVEAVSGLPLIASQRYTFISGTGFVGVPEHGPLGHGEVFSGKELLQVASGELDDPSSRRCAKRVMRSALRAVIGERPLHSRSLFAEGRAAR